MRLYLLAMGMAVLVVAANGCVAVTAESGGMQPAKNDTAKPIKYNTYQLTPANHGLEKVVLIGDSFVFTAPENSEISETWTAEFDPTFFAQQGSEVIQMTTESGPTPQVHRKLTFLVQGLGKSVLRIKRSVPGEAAPREICLYIIDSNDIAMLKAKSGFIY